MTGQRPAQAQEDARLLECFVARHEEGAFAELMRRHGPMVLAVCRRILRDANDADDAFQAVFLVLWRKASAIGRRELLANWLYGVAYRIAHRLRAQVATRRSHESQGEGLALVDPPQKDSPSDACSAWSDVRPLLDDELSRLPSKYRLPLVLCYLEGSTREEAARRLDWPPGTVAGRLARARDLLRTRLARRGISLSGVALASILEKNARAALPAVLREAALHTVALAAAGSARRGSPG